MLVFGGVLFWILIAAIGIVILASVEYEKPVLSTISVVGFFVLLAYLGDFSLWAFVVHHPTWSLIGLAAYVFFGVCWSYCKWHFFVVSMAQRYNENFRERVELIKQYENEKREKRESGSEWITMRKLDSLSNKIHCCESEMSLNRKPEAKKFKRRIMIWMVHWPWSCIWTIINDPIKKLFKYIFRKLQAFYQRIADKAYCSTEEFRPWKDDRKEKKSGGLAINDEDEKED